MEPVTCKDARIDIALLAGNDLDAAGEQKLKRHMAACPHCRDHWQSMRRSVRVLQEPAEQTVRRADSSLWPALSQRLPARERRRYRDRFNGWGPAVAVIAACSLLLMFAGSPQVPTNGPSRVVPSISSDMTGRGLGPPSVFSVGNGPYGNISTVTPHEAPKPDRNIAPDTGFMR